MRRGSRCILSLLAFAFIFNRLWGLTVALDLVLFSDLGSAHHLHYPVHADAAQGVVCAAVSVEYAPIFEMAVFVHAMIDTAISITRESGVLEAVEIV